MALKVQLANRPDVSAHAPGPVDYDLAIIGGGFTGLSTALTAVAQGALAWYATVLVGEAAAKYLEGKTVRKVIVVPKRLVNFVVS